MVQNYTPIDDLIQKYQQKQAPLLQSKEGEPIRKSAEAPTLQETTEQQPTQEVSSFLTKKHEFIQLPPDLSAIGVKSIEDTETNSFFDKVKLPLSDDEVVQGMHAPITSSLRWLATFAIYLLLQAHLTLKVMHGKVRRVARRG